MHTPSCQGGTVFVRKQFSECLSCFHTSCGQKEWLSLFWTPRMLIKSAAFEERHRVSLRAEENCLRLWKFQTVSLSRLRGVVLIPCKISKREQACLLAAHRERLGFFNSGFLSWSPASSICRHLVPFGSSCENWGWEMDEIKCWHPGHCYCHEQ